MGTSIYPVPYSGIQETTIDAKGDLLVGTAADAVSRLAVGTNTYVLTADSAEATGLKWATASSAFPTFSAYRSGSNQSIGASTFTKVQLNGEAWDSDNCFDSTTNYRFTPTTAGYYQINAMIGFSTTGGAEGIVAIYKNGANAGWVTYTSFDANSAPTYNGSLLLYLNGSTDYVEMFAYLVASTREIVFGTAATIFSGVGIRS